jgi:predicted nucleic acid-binding protein
MSRLYLDANVVIRLIEDEPARRAAVWDILAAHGGPDRMIVVSDLVRLECRVKPMAAGDAALLDPYARYFASPDVTVITLPTPVYDRATEIRARSRYGLADALQFAAAIESGCDSSVTGDVRLAGFSDIPVVLVGPA